MPPRKKTGERSLEEILTGFADQLEQQAHRPNMNRIKPLPKQELFLQSQTKHRILFGGNRGGKTFGGVYDDCLLVTRRHPYRNHLYADRPRRIRFIGVDFDRGILQGAIPYFQQFLPPSVLINGSWEDSYSKAERLLTLEDGSTVSFMSYEQDPNKFQIVSLDHIHFDEEPPEAIFRESVMRLVDTGGTWTISETPVQQLEWIHDELMTKALPPEGDGTRSDIEVFRLDTRENINLDPDEVRNLEATMSEEEKLIRLEGRYPGGDLVFPEFQPRYPHVIETDDWMPHEPGWTIYASMDYGFANPTAWLWTAVHEDGSIVTFKCLYAKSVVVDEWARLVHSMNRSIGTQLGYGPDWRPAAYVGDPSIASKSALTGVTGTTIQQEYAMRGIPIGTEGIVSARSGNQNIGLSKMHAYLRPRPSDLRSAATNHYGMPWWQITRNCAPLIDEMRRARKPRQTLKNKDEKNPSEQIRDKDNHAIDAIKYLFMISHDLRPAQFRGPQQVELPDELRGASVYDDNRAKRPVYDTNTGWSVSSGGYDFSELGF